MEKRRGRRSLKTALLQILPGNSLEENLEKGLFWCREAKKAGADLALFPEMWSSGYDIPESVEELEHKAVASDGPFVKAFANAARELSMATDHDPGTASGRPKEHAAFTGPSWGMCAVLCEGPYL